MSALYCEPKLRDFGLADHGWRGFGGILSNLNDGKIPQYNLAAFWKRPVGPIVTGFAEHVIRRGTAKTVCRRPPGSWRADLDPSTFNNINYLAATTRDMEEVTIRSVSAESIGYSVLEHTAKFQDGLLSSEGALQNKASFNEPVLELRSSEVNKSQLWTRSKGHLILAEPHEDRKECVFRGSVRSFEECRTLPGDVALCDMNGMIWSGTVGASLSRTKTSQNDCKLITYTDHPRVVLVSSSHEIKNLDLRMNVSKSHVLFEVPELAKKEPTEKANYIPEEALERPCISQLKTLTDCLHNFFVLTAHSAYLCDDRFPKKSVLSMFHSIPYGAHVLQVANPVPDFRGAGKVVSIYFLDHLLTGIWVSRLYWHSCNAWSSILPIHMMDDCLDFQRLVKPSLSRPIRKSRSDPLNGVAVVQGFKDVAGRDVDLLLSSSDGDVFYQTMRYGWIEDTELKALWIASRERMKSTWSSIDNSNIFLSPPLESSGDSFFSVEFEIGEATGAKKEWNPLKKKVYRKCRPLDLLETANTEAVLPKVVNKGCCGFRGSLSCSVNGSEENAHNVANLAQTYSGLLCLAILGDNFERVNRIAVLKSLQASQKEDGSFWSEGMGSESDMRFVFCAVAISHILQDYSYINWVSLGAFIKASLNYDGGIGQGPGDESHGGSTFCAIASLSLSNRLWDESVLTRKEISQLVKWALWKHDHGFHGRAHKDDDSCYAFWIGATLEILNADHFVDKERLRSFLLIAQHRPLGGFCKVPDPTGFPDMILLPPADLDQEEAIFWVLTHLQTFMQNADCLISRVTSRLEKMNNTYQQLQSRMETVNRKVDALRRMNTTVVLTCLSTFPESNKSRYEDISSPTVIDYQKPVFTPKTRPRVVVDIRRELEERKRFYLPSQLIRRTSNNKQELRIQRKAASFADMFYAGTDELAFGEKAVSTVNSGKRLGAKNESHDNGSGFDVPTIGGEQSRTLDPLDYIPEIGPIEELDLPSILPDLPGIAEDITLPDIDVVLPSFPDFSHVINEPRIFEESDSQGERRASVPNPSKSSNDSNENAQLEKSIDIAIEEKPETLVTVSHEILESPYIPAPAMSSLPPPPPPPPPPPALLVSPTPTSSQVSSIPQGNDRSDLMAAIRAAGGAGKAKLRSVGVKRRPRESESLGSSALSEKNSSPGNDLMTSLAKALEARRKAISGMSSSVAGMDGASKGIEGTSTDDEWK